MPTRATPRILVVGGGFAGRAAVRYFLRAVEGAHIILIDEKCFFEFTPSLLRCIAEPAHLRRVTFGQHSDPHFTHVAGKVNLITGHEATVERRQGEGRVVASVPFDYCVWATGVGYMKPVGGVSWSGGAAVGRRKGEFGYFRHRVMTADEVLIIGAGPIGVELTAELVAMTSRNGSPRIILAASSRGVLPRLPRKAGIYARAWLTRRRVCILNAKVKPSTLLPGGNREYTDTSNPPVVLTPDLVFDCTGAKPNGSTSAMVAGGVCDASLINGDGSVSVLSTLQLPDAPHILVAGDATRVPDELSLSGLSCEKTAYAAEEAGSLAARNITMLMRSESLISSKPSGLHQYPGDAFPCGRFPRLFVISLHKYHGILCVGPLVVCGILPAAVKFAIEVCGVASAHSDNIISIVFRALERMTYYVATALAIMSAKFRRHYVD